MKRKLHRGFVVSVRTGLFKKPVITITDGKQTVSFVVAGSFTIETDKPFPEPIIKPDR